MSSSSSAKGVKAACSRIFNRLIAESQKFPQLNYREYFGRLATEQKSSLKGLDDPLKLQQIKERAKADLAQMRRMVLLNQLYIKNPSILEVPHGADARPRRKTEDGNEKHT